MALLAVARCMRDELHGPGDHVFDQGAPADGLRVVADGRLFTFQRATPWPKLLVFCGNNDAIGDDCCLHTSAKVWLYGCSAKSHSQVYFVPLADLLHIVEEYAIFRTAGDRGTNGPTTASCGRSRRKLLDRSSGCCWRGSGGGGRWGV